MPLPIPDVTSTATRGFAQEVTFLHGLSHVGPIGDPYGRTGPTNLWHKFGGATHTCIRSHCVLETNQTVLTTWHSLASGRK